VLLGKPYRRYLMRENEDGNILLQPTTVVTMAQHEFQSTPELQDLLARATTTPTSIESVNAAHELHRH
jgi:hypothetical protein